MTRSTSRRRAHRAAAVVTTMVALVAAAGVPARADYSSGGMPTRTFNYRTVGINDTWVSFYDTGNIRWNQRVNSRIGRSTSAAATATAGSYADGWWGLYTPYGRRYVNRTFKIQNNVRTLLRDAGQSRLAAWSQANCAHELGHALSMADNPANSGGSIMIQGRLDTYQLPTAYDIREVERIY